MIKDVKVGVKEKRASCSWKKLASSWGYELSKKTGANDSLD